MLAGVKIIPRDQLDDVREKADIDGGKTKRRKGKPSREKRRKKKKSSYDSSEDEVTEKIKSGARRRKKWYSSDDDGTDSSVSSSSCSGSESSLDHGGKGSGRKRGKRNRARGAKRSYLSSGDDGSSGRDEGRGKSKRSGQEKIRGSGSLSDQEDKELLRKEMGLEWMSKPMNKTDKKIVDIDMVPNEPHEELWVFLFCFTDLIEDVTILTLAFEGSKAESQRMNPYFRDNGGGYPDDEPRTPAGGNQLPPPAVVGDGGASWRLKALKRAKEQAAREGRKIDEVVEERWGSLGELAASVASRRAAPTHAHLHAIKDRKRGVAEKSERNGRDQTERFTEEVGSGKREYLQNLSSPRPNMRRPKAHDSLSWGKRKNQNMSVEDTELIASAVSGLNKFANDGSFHKAFVHQNKDDEVQRNTPYMNAEGREHVEVERVTSKTNDPSETCHDPMEALHSNKLAALRLKGKHEEADKLLREMEAAAKNQDTEVKMISRGTHGATNSHAAREMLNKRGEDDADKHLAQKIMQNRQYTMSSRADDEYDFDDAPSKRHNRRKGGMSSEKNVIPKRILTQQERCQFCFENPTRPKHLVVSIANFTYMMLPQWQPVVQGHCCILPMQHESSTRNLDDNVWEEMRNFKKCLLMMFAKQDKDVVFLETVMNLSQQRRHCLIECIPLPKELAREAPLYFKKAIDEAEDEWSQHNAKKLIPTGNKGLRASIPKNFPYFHVEFGLKEGYVHVIDDEKQFKSSLGLNVIRGMLQLPEEDMHRRRRLESVEAQRQAVARFVSEWEPFDWTKQLD
ncbi:hypothetical protein QJS10_CPA08g00175 [Acorus calamus]|uniref:CWF19-like protein 2 n=1 Tax=Acorus calamus TaxID=4465 RepID=A0AAV9ECA5_ACOCL|nr:hypothetical protein QJS10_CPA08g00175 [Acorus calamus]